MRKAETGAFMRVPSAQASGTKARRTSTDSFLARHLRKVPPPSLGVIHQRKALLGN